MGRLNLLQTSSLRGFEGTWPQASLSESDIHWARRNLVRDKDGICSFQNNSQSRSSAGVNFEDYVPLLPKKWEDRVVFEDGKNHPRVLLQMGRHYDFREKFELAYAERDPAIAPHVMFQSLSPGNDAVALGFIKECGPLFLDDFDLHANIWVDLNDFWIKHSRFVAIVRLYEQLEECEALRAALSNMLQNLDSLNAAGPTPVGYIPDPQKNHPFLKLVDFSDFKSDEYNLRGGDGALEWKYPRLRKHARRIILAELTLQTNEGLRSGWENLAEEEGPGFRPIRIITSLWAALWEMFGLETWRGYSWRSCKICGMYFYPMQTNSDCCNPQHQALWSKREYARKRRTAEKGKSAKKRKMTEKRT
ncbi:MAG: hypothetical protein ABR987_11740 [Terracidiphilus sp.]